MLPITVLLGVACTNASAQNVWNGSTVRTYTGANVGIGTASAETNAKLHIYGNNPALGGGGLTDMLIDRTTTTLSGSSVSDYFKVIHNYSGAGGASATVFIINKNEKVGIGKAGPSARLDVGGTFNADGNGSFGNNVTVAQKLGVGNNADIAKNLTVGLNATIDKNLFVRGGRIDMGMSPDYALRMIQGSTSNGMMALTVNTGSSTGATIDMFGSTFYEPAKAGALYYSSNSATGNKYGHKFCNYDGGQTSLMGIQSNGKVVIGKSLIEGDPATSTPNGYLLYVQKGILTEKVNVAIAGTPNWSDFVFEEDYSLMPLSKVESFVKQNKHLPEVPSATEVKRDGIDVAAMDAKLLQKIEELTLYAIEQQKRTDKLQKIIEIQQREIDEMKAGTIRN